MNFTTFFPQITAEQQVKLDALAGLYKDWNQKINVISRKDMDNFEVHHVLHSLAIAKFFSFSAGTRIMDAGTGGGFPGIPLAIIFPDVEFTLVDSIGKKIKVVDEVRRELGLMNVIPRQARFDEMKETFDFVTGRAVTALPGLFQMLRNRISKKDKNSFSNGIIYLKGGDFEDELKQIEWNTKIWDLQKYFDDPFFETKKLVYLSAR